MRRIDLTVDADDSGEAVPILLVRRTDWAREDAGLPPISQTNNARAREKHDRLAPWSSGALMGGLAGLAGVATAHLLDVTIAPRIVAFAERLTALAHEASIAVAAGTIFVACALLGSIFTTVTRNLRKLLPLLIWALVFFPSLGLLAQAAVLAFTRYPAPAKGHAVLAGCAVFAFLAALSLPLRRRERAAWLDEA